MNSILSVHQVNERFHPLLLMVFIYLFIDSNFIIERIICGLIG